jgi:hypothetical protein
MRMKPSHPSISPADESQACHRICLTPTRNESWIVDKFVAAAKTWAGHIIVADQKSDDGTLDILRNSVGVEIAINDSPTYDENHRQKLLLSRARRIPGKRILIGLDADEALSANAVSSRDWERIEQAKPGTILRFRWVNLLPGFERAWVLPHPVPFGFVDDGAEHTGARIHSARVPQPANAPTLDLEDIVVLHFQYVVWERMASKQRWYQAWEYTQHRQKSPLDIFREYHHMHGSWDKSEMQEVRHEWLAGYEERGINFRSLTGEPITWWDREIVQMLCQHGPAHFRRVAIWNQDWNTIAQRLGLNAPDLRDPRSPFDKAAHRILAATQAHRGNWGVRGFERALRLAGW